MSDPRADDDTQPIGPHGPVATAGASAATADPQARTQAAEQPSPEPEPSRTADLAPSDRPSAESGPSRTADLAPSAAPAGASVAQPVQPSQQHTDQPAPRTPPPARPSGRKARLRLARVDPWSVMKMALALSIAAAIVLVVAVAIIWSVLSAAGVWDAINDSISAVLDGDTNGFDVEDYVSLERVVGVAMVLAALNVVLMTTLATLAAFLYNLAASLLGGLEVTLAEDR